MRVQEVEAAPEEPSVPLTYAERLKQGVASRAGSGASSCGPAPRPAGSGGSQRLPTPPPAAAAADQPPPAAQAPPVVAPQVDAATNGNGNGAPAFVVVRFLHLMLLAACKQKHSAGHKVPRALVCQGYYIGGVSMLTALAWAHLA